MSPQGTSLLARTERSSNFRIVLFILLCWKHDGSFSVVYYENLIELQVKPTKSQSVPPPHKRTGLLGVFLPPICLRWTSRNSSITVQVPLLWHWLPQRFPLVGFCSVFVSLSNLRGMGGAWLILRILEELTFWFVKTFYLLGWSGYFKLLTCWILGNTSIKSLFFFSISFLMEEYPHGWIMCLFLSPPTPPLRKQSIWRTRYLPSSFFLATLSLAFLHIYWKIFHCTTAVNYQIWTCNIESTSSTCTYIIRLFDWSDPPTRLEAMI